MDFVLMYQVIEIKVIEINKYMNMNRANKPIIGLCSVYLIYINQTNECVCVEWPAVAYYFNYQISSTFTFFNDLDYEIHSMNTIHCIANSTQ